MGNKISRTLCVAANNQSVYLAAYDKGKTDGNLVLLRSNPFPTSLKSATWELLAKQPAKEIFSEGSLDPNNYNCAASNDGAFMILLRELPSTKAYRDFIGAVVDTSSNGWEMFKFGTSICLESCWGLLLAMPAGSSASFMLVVRYQGGYATDTNRTLSFLTYKTGTNHFMEQQTAFDVQRSTNSNKGDNFEFLGNQFVQLSFAWPEGNTSNVYNTTITTTLFDLNTQGLPDPTRQSNNATMTNLRCLVDKDGSSSGTSNSVLYFVCKFSAPYLNQHTLYSWDGRGDLHTIREFQGILIQHSFTPVPASEGNASWSVVLAGSDVDLGLFGLGISGPETGYWQSDKSAKVSAKGLPSDLSTGGIVGISVGAVALVVIAGFAVRTWRRRLKNKKRDVELSKIGSRK
ncbi:hypothetical protein BGZ81_001744 [Podila clonocystis]|nr:hypothetical protein BGZ81_001744 [Podila clonocystis]